MSTEAFESLCRFMKSLNNCVILVIICDESSCFYFPHLWVCTQFIVDDLGYILDENFATQVAVCTAQCQRKRRLEVIQRFATLLLHRAQASCSCSASCFTLARSASFAAPRAMLLLHRAQASCNYSASRYASLVRSVRFLFFFLRR